MRRRARARSAAVAVFAIVVLMIAGGEEAEACLHPPNDDREVEVSQSDHVGLLYFREGRQELVLSTGVASDVQLARLGWVVPVPSVPDEYGTAEPGLFEAMAEWVRLKVFHQGFTLSAGPSSPGEDGPEANLRVMEAVERGPYSITPLKAKGERGREALVKWLKENGFRVPASTEPVEYYVDRGWTFLAARIDPAEGAEYVATGGRLPPLHLSFETSRAVYPLKFETNQGEFSVRIYVLTERPLRPPELAGAVERGFFVAGAPHPGERYVGGAPVERFRGISQPGLFFPVDVWKSPPGLGSLESRRATMPIPSVQTLDALRSNVRPGYPVGAKFMVEKFRVDRSSAPRELAGLLAGTGAWSDDSPLYLRTLFAPAFNRGYAEPDEWSEDLSIPPPPIGGRLNGEGAERGDTNVD